MGIEKGGFGCGGDSSMNLTRLAGDHDSGQDPFGVLLEAEPYNVQWATNNTPPPVPETIQWDSLMEGEKKFRVAGDGFEGSDFGIGTVIPSTVEQSARKPFSQAPIVLWFKRLFHL